MEAEWVEYNRPRQQWDNVYAGRRAEVNHGRISKSHTAVTLALLLESYIEVTTFYTNSTIIHTVIVYYTHRYSLLYTPLQFIIHTITVYYTHRYSLFFAVMIKSIYYQNSCVTLAHFYFTTFRVK